MGELICDKIENVDIPPFWGIPSFGIPGMFGESSGKIMYHPCIETKTIRRKMSTKFYRYVYGRQNYNRYRDLAIANDCSLPQNIQTLQQQIQAWREWERQYQENRENGLPPPPRPDPIPAVDLFLNGRTQAEIDACKLAYTALHKKEAMNPNSNILSTNRRIGYWMNHQYRLPMMTVWY